MISKTASKHATKKARQLFKKVPKEVLEQVEGNKLVSEYVKKKYGRGGFLFNVDWITLSSAGKKGIYDFKGKATRHSLVSFPPSKSVITFNGIVDVIAKKVSSYKDKVLTSIAGVPGR